MNRIDEILHYWFGSVEETILPSEHRTHIWFSGEPDVDAEIQDKFFDDYRKAVRGDYIEWENTPRGTLALIIILDQFSRNLFRNQPKAFEQDQKALDLCLRGIEKQFDHQLSLIERIFFYFPLMHTENLEMQSLSVRAYQMLVNLSFPETRPVFDKFLDYATRHYEVINRFGRFPYRNEALGRISSDTEIKFLQDSGLRFDG